MRKFFAVAMGSAVALLGFAGAANASATVDLIWIDVSVTNTAGNPVCLLAKQRNCPQLGTTISSVAVTDDIALVVLLTAGPTGSLGASVSVDYRDTPPEMLSVTGFQSMLTTVPAFYLPLALGTAFDEGTWVDGINAGAAPPIGAGIGLPAGSTAYIGTVTFHEDVLINGTFDIGVGVFGTKDGVLDGFGNTIDATLNGAVLINVPEPGALSLLVMGVGGMLLAGRGRRS